MVKWFESVYVSGNHRTNKNGHLPIWITTPRSIKNKLQ